MRRSFVRRPVGPALAVAAVTALAAGPVDAHVSGAMGGGIAAGFAHPLTGLDHLLAMISVGVWGAELGAPAIWLLPITFPLVMAIGAVFGVIGIPLPSAELLIALSVVTLGALVALAQRLALGLALLIVAVFAVAHGYAHGVEMPDAADALAFTVGFVVATGLLHAAGIAIGLVGRWRGGALALRGFGLLIALAGCYFVYSYARA